MITIKNLKINIINIIFQQEENKIPICILYTKEKINNKEITISIHDKDYFKGYYLKEKFVNNLYEYIFIGFNKKIYLAFYKNLFEKNKNNIITDNIFDYIDGFIKIDILTHDIKIINFFKEEEKIYDFNILQKNIINTETSNINSVKDITIVVEYPNIELSFNNYIHTEDFNFIKNLSNDNNKEILKTIKQITQIKNNNKTIFQIEMPITINGKKILEYSYIYNNNQYSIPRIKDYDSIIYKNNCLKNINIYYKNTKIKPQEMFKIIENIAYKGFIYHNPINIITIYIKINDNNKLMIFNIQLYDIFQKEKDFYKIFAIEIIYNNQEKICKLTGKLFINMEKNRKRNFSNESNQILEKNIESYYLPLEEVFYFNDNLIFKNINLCKEFRIKKTNNIIL
jgi:hypothetical protein